MQMRRSARHEGAEETQSRVSVHPSDHEAVQGAQEAFGVSLTECHQGILDHLLLQVG